MKSLNRRTFAGLAVGSVVVPAIATAADTSQSGNSSAIQGEEFHIKRAADRPKPKVAMLLYPGLTLLDLVGPHTALAASCDVHLVWKNKDPLMSDSGVVLRPDITSRSRNARPIWTPFLFLAVLGRSLRCGTILFWTSWSIGPRGQDM